MNAPTFSRICAHSGSSFGSNTTHCVPRNSDSSRNSAIRRTGTYFHSDPRSLSPSSVRAPQTTLPYTGNVRRQLTAVRVQHAVLAVADRDREPTAPTRRPRCPPAPSRRRARRRCAAQMPATKPHGGKDRIGLALQRIRRIDPREVEAAIARFAAVHAGHLGGGAVHLHVLRAVRRGGTRARALHAASRPLNRRRRPTRRARTPGRTDRCRSAICPFFEQVQHGRVELRLGALALVLFGSSTPPSSPLVNACVSSVA